MAPAVDRYASFSRSAVPLARPGTPPVEQGLSRARFLESRGLLAWGMHPGKAVIKGGRGVRSQKRRRSFYPLADRWKDRGYFIVFAMACLHQ
jgi:hypothetical protein